MSGYFAGSLRRAIVDPNRCVFNDCMNRNLSDILDMTKAKILVEHNFYLPPTSRMCLQHLEEENWEDLTSSLNNTISDFTLELKAAETTQLMGSLSAPRVTASRAFERVGIEFVGSVSAKNSRIGKGYIAVFICFTTKAIHLDFLHIIAIVFKAARWFGIPSQGAMATMCISLIILVMLFALEVTAIWKLARTFGGWDVVEGSVIARLSGAIFYGNALFSQILTWKFITSWKYLSYHWMRADTALGVPLLADDNIRKKITIVTGVVSICATLEHALSMMAATGFDCLPENYFERYILTSHGFLLNSHEYSLLLGIPIFLLSKFATIMWNFQDLIIILVSIGLTSKYRRLNWKMNYIITFEQKIYNQSLKYSQVQTWRRLRQAYVRQAALVRRVGNKLSHLILLSNLNNLYFICLQLFLGINNEQGPPINRIYYLLSLSWLISRACGVVLAAADIQIHSKIALPLLQTTCSTFNVEVDRLKKQLKFDRVALQGMGLFCLDRRLLLKVAAAILTYELILIEFDN
ncbi:gustatory receptor for sugar taste 64a-like [Leguminivora glycinivorella]|uniref:gustatory receptor for sugar taste 64a-like n=1 Tax=Leguminivora glycinivorella TaxID=1035111 RepID=UPI00200C6B9C|nr:gustatory receptor for sugar taste 64a-like [Leguminivora glycinivorella]